MIEILNLSIESGKKATELLFGRLFTFIWEIEMAALCGAS